MKIKILARRHRSRFSLILRAGLSSRNRKFKRIPKMMESQRRARSSAIRIGVWKTCSSANPSTLLSTPLLAAPSLSLVVSPTKELSKSAMKPNYKTSRTKKSPQNSKMKSMIKLKKWATILVLKSYMQNICIKSK